MSEDDTSRIFRDGYFNSCILEALTHGIYTSIFVSALSKSLRRRRFRPAFLVALLFMYTCATLHLAVRWWWVRTAFIAHGETPATIIDSFLSDSNQWMWAISGVSTSLLIATADAVLVWRCWTVWFCDIRPIILPCLSMLVGWVFNGLFLWQDITHDSDASHLNWGIKAVNWGVAFFSCSLFTTLSCTGLIVFRIVRLGCTPYGISISSSPYRVVIEILVESAAVYALSLLVFMIFLARDDPINVYPQALLISSAGIAPTLIVARIASGRARPDDSWQTSFTPSSNSGTLTFARSKLKVAMRRDIVTDDDSDADREMSVGKDCKSVEINHEPLVVGVDVMELETRSRTRNGGIDTSSV